MEKTIFPHTISGTVSAPTSKSYFQRAIAAGLLSEGTSRIKYKNHCNDSYAAIQVVKMLGARISDNPPILTIEGGLQPAGTVLDCMESGLCLRMFSPIAALLSTPFTLQGSGSLCKRSQLLIVDSLKKLGVGISSNNGLPPIKLHGPLQGGTVTIDGSQSSQLITGLFMALPLVRNDSVLEVANLKSKRYLDMTLELLADFGVSIKRKRENQFLIRGNQMYRACDYQVEGDWSGAAFWIVAGLLFGNISIEGLKQNSLQADSEIIRFLSQFSLNLSISSQKLSINKSKIPAFEFDATHCPDLFPPLVVLASYATGVCRIDGINRLIHKESNRAVSLQEEFGKLGIRISLSKDSMMIHPGEIKSGEVSSHNDHRIAMALAIAALGAKGPVSIRGSESVEKSYPGFWEELERLLNEKIQRNI